MTHTDALNALLAHLDPVEVDGKFRRFLINPDDETPMVVDAILVHENPGRNIFLYEIVNVQQYEDEHGFLLGMVS